MKSAKPSPISHQRTRRGGHAARALALGLPAFLVSLALAASAVAAPPEFLLRMPNDRVQPGSGAAEFNWPSGIVGDPDTGHLYISESNNRRVSEYTAWGLFVKSWGWGVANGASELQTCGPAVPEAAPPSTLCQEGIAGDGKGQLDRPSGIAMDPAGNLYVLEESNARVQKFTQSGQFLLMFGGKVNQTKVEEGAPAAEQNVCPVAPADVCQAGTGTSGPGGSIGELTFDTITYSPATDAIVVGDIGRIQEFDLDGSFKAQIPFEGALDAFEGQDVRGLDVDLAGNIYFSVSGIEDLYKLSPSGEPLEPGKPGESQFDVPNPLVVEVDGEGNVYATDVAVPWRVLKFDPVANKLLPTKEEEEQNKPFPNLPGNPQLIALGTNLCAGSEAPGNLYVGTFNSGVFSFVDAYGTPPIGCEPPPPNPPLITSQYATSVQTDSARLRAEINPRFFDDATYFVQYGEGKCSEGGCDKEQPASPGSLLTSKVLNKAVTTSTVALAGLEPGTTYHYRFVSESSGGGPVFGEERSFRTFALPAPQVPCPNDAFRAGPSGRLPDCRAYELVSPFDKDNGDAALLPATKTYLEVNQSATSGERFTYSSITPFSDPGGAPFISQLLAQRDPDSGWSNEAISPPRSARVLDLNLSLNNDFKAFSADLCMGWLHHNSASTLTEAAIPGYANLYRRDNCPTPASYEALSTAVPPKRPANEYLLNPQGFSEDGTKSIFLADDELIEDAPTLKPEELHLYIHSAEGGLRYVCYLPSGVPNPTACGAGMVAGEPDGDSSAVQNAISKDGSRLFWTAFKGGLTDDFGSAPVGVSGKVYVRLNPDQEQSTVEGGECTEPELACTIAVSQSVTPEAAEYWGASEDGAKAIFKVAKGPLAGNLYEFDVDAKKPTLIAEGVEDPMGMTEDTSHVYFSSSKVLAEGASEGAHNLYHYEAGEGGGSTSFIMELVGDDFLGSGSRPSAINEVPTERSSTISPDGMHAAFTSSASPTPTGYDNTDAVSGEPDAVAYLYDAETEVLRCVSCNPTGARPAGVKVDGFWTAARLAAPKVPLQSPRTLSEDGKRLFFESFEALVPRDTNGTWDVYQWEAAGKGSCDEADPTYGEDAEGCVELISSGESPAASRFLDADPGGSNVFIGTQSSLIGADYGLSDVYVARVGGGLPEPVPPPGECEGEACQSPPAPPATPTPASAAFNGPGNPPQSKPRRRRCGKGTRRVRRGGKARCIKKQTRNRRRAVR